MILNSTFYDNHKCIITVTVNTLKKKIIIKQN